MCIQWLEYVLFILTGSLLITENLACNVVFTRDQLITLRLGFVAGEKLTIPAEIVRLQCDCQREDEEKGDPCNPVAIIGNVGPVK